MGIDRTRAAGLALAAALLVAAGPAGAGEAAGTVDGHGVEATAFDAGDLKPGEKERIETLFARIICACPRENWTKTLAGCPDGCADRQKDMVRRGVRAGKSDQSILDEQLRTFGTQQVLAIPDSPMATWFPYAALAALAAVVVTLLNRSVRRGRREQDGESGPPGAAGAGPAAPASPTAEDREAGERVERDLREMDP